MNSRDIREVNAFVEALDRSLDAGALRNSRIRSLAQDISRMSET